MKQEEQAESGIVNFLASLAKLADNSYLSLQPPS
jgi:hypothetical protein